MANTDPTIKFTIAFLARLTCRQADRKSAPYCYGPAERAEAKAWGRLVADVGRAEALRIYWALDARAPAEYQVQCCPHT